MSLIAYAHSLFHRLTDDQDGASLVEYALLIALIAIVAVIAVTAFGVSLSEEYSEINTAIP